MNNTKAFELSKLIDNELKTEEDIKEWLSLNLAEYLEDGNLNAFVRSLEYVVRAKDNISNLSRKTGISETQIRRLIDKECVNKTYEFEYIN